MYFTTKSRYATQIMLDLANWKEKRLRQRSEVARRHNIPPKYMDQIICSLKQHNLIKTHRGPNGGLELGYCSNKISLWDIFTAVEKTLEPVICLHDSFSCEQTSSCLSRPLWQDVYSRCKEALSSCWLCDYTINNKSKK
jgi:Rrf2 family protein